MDAVVDLPVRQVDLLRVRWFYLGELYITTSRENLPPGAEPQAGAVFHVTPGVRGLPTGTFAASPSSATPGQRADPDPASSSDLCAATREYRGERHTMSKRGKAAP